MYLKYLLYLVTLIELALKKKFNRQLKKLFLCKENASLPFKSSWILRSLVIIQKFEIDEARLMHERDTTTPDMTHQQK